MSKIITSSVWNASNIPSGITLDPANGIFSGTPTANAGEYSVPVSVNTNYGADTKDVKFVVKEITPHGVYALGADAARWSNNAEPDAYGFRKLNIPNATKVSTIAYGFAAKCQGGRWFIGSSATQTRYGGNGSSDGISYYTPAEFPVDNVNDIKGSILLDFGVNKTSSYDTYFAYRINNEVHFFWYPKSGSSLSSHSWVLNNIALLPNGYSNSWVMLRNDNRALLGRPKDNISATEGYPTPQNVTKIISHYLSSIGERILYISDSGKLFQCQSGSLTQLMPDINNFVNLWVQPLNTGEFALTSDKKLYARGNNRYYQLGSTDKSIFSDFQLIGEYDVKKIDHTFMLTRDGKLFHSSSYANHSDSTLTGGPHEGWTHIFPDYRFIDFAYLSHKTSTPGYQTLVAIIDD